MFSENGIDTVEPTLKNSAPSAAELFEFAYGRAPTDSELKLASAVVHSGRDMLSKLRAILSSVDRQTNPSRLFVRFSGDDIDEKKFDGFTLVVDKHDVAASHPMIYGSYEPHLVNVFKDLIKPGMTVADIGGNIGFYSMLFASLVGASGRVMTFEPNSENCRLILLSKNVNGFENIELFPIGLSDVLGYSYFTSALGTNGGFMAGPKASLMSPSCVVVPTMRLDDLVKSKVDLLKLDIEGAEYRALWGARQLITDHRPVITIEFSDEMTRRVSGIEGRSFLKWLTSLGYQGHLINRETFGLELISDVDAFMSNWGSIARIEDFVFYPVS